MAGVAAALVTVLVMILVTLLLVDTATEVTAQLPRITPR